MCSLCGVFGGGDHWTDAAARPGVFTRSSDPVSRRRDRARRVALANRVLRHYGMELSDWQSASFLLSTRTGKIDIVDHLGHLWTKAEALSGKACDPLDPAFLMRCESAVG